MASFQIEKPRVAVFNTQPPHLYIGGVERRILEVAQELTAKVDTTIYSGTKKGFKKTATFNGANIVPCNSTDKFFPIDNWSFNRTTSRMFDPSAADVYEGHNVSGYGVFKALKKRGASSRFIHTIHGPLADEFKQASKEPLRTFRDRISRLGLKHLAKIEQQLARDSNLIVTVSQYSQKKIIEYYDVDPAKIHIVPNGVNCERFKPIEKAAQVKHDIGVAEKMCVLFVGQLIPRKGLPFLIEAAQQITQKEKDVAFVIIGDGPLRDSLIEQVAKRGLMGYFKFLGNARGEALSRLYNCADIFVLPSLQEGQGIVLLEAQATGIPVVAFNTGAISESIIDKETGLLVKPDVQELESAILDLMANSSLRQKMGTNGRKFVSKNLSWDTCAKKMLHIYREAAE